MWVASYVEGVARSESQMTFWVLVCSKGPLVRTYFNSTISSEPFFRGRAVSAKRLSAR